MIKSAIVNSIEYKTNIETANNFNEYFVNNIKEITDKIEYVKYIDQQSTNKQSQHTRDKF